MKNENFNLNINALDDKALYLELCKAIKETNNVSFKLLGFVPIISGGINIGIWLNMEYIPLLVLIFTGLFGAAITFCIYRWELRNIQTNQTFRDYAVIIETRKKQMELQKEIPPEPNDGPYNLLISKDKPVLFGKVRWGKKESESAVYMIVIMFWLMSPFMKLIPFIQVTLP